jgi:hypothetical protein
MHREIEDAEHGMEAWPTRFCRVSIVNYQLSI